jgi:hypothetical protein
VTGDEVYGDSPRLRELIQEQGKDYVLAVSANTRVWTQRPEVEEPQAQTGGRPRRAPRVAQGAPKARLVSEVISSLPKSAWKRLAVVEGEKGAITYHWARVRVVESRDQLPGPEVWLLARRSPARLTNWPITWLVLQPRPHWQPWHVWLPVATPSSSVSRKPKEKRGSMSMKCASGTAGIATSRSR